MKTNLFNVYVFKGIQCHFLNTNAPFSISMRASEWRRVSHNDRLARVMHHDTRDLWKGSERTVRRLYSDSQLKQYVKSLMHVESSMHWQLLRNQL